MPIVPTLIFWSIAWLPPVGMNGQSMPTGNFGTACQCVEAAIASPFALKQADPSTTAVLSLTDLATPQTDDDDLCEGDALDFGLLPQWADSSHADAVSHFLPVCNRADCAGCPFPIRC